MIGVEGYATPIQHGSTGLDGAQLWDGKVIPMSEIRRMYDEWQPYPHWTFGLSAAYKRWLAQVPRVERSGHNSAGPRDEP